jgi:hypothetical protein
LSWLKFCSDVRSRESGVLELSRSSLARRLLFLLDLTSHIVTIYHPREWDEAKSAREFSFKQGSGKGNSHPRAGENSYLGPESKTRFIPAKRIRRVDMLESEIEVLVQSYPARWRDDARIALAPYLREKTLRGAVTHYAPVITGEKVLLILDDTLFGSGSKGILLTDRKIYSSQSGDDGSKSQCFDLAAVRTAHVRDGNSLWMNGRLFFKTKLHPETLYLLRNLLAQIRHLFLWEDIQKKGYPRRPEAASPNTFSENQPVPVSCAGERSRSHSRSQGKSSLRPRMRWPRSHSGARTAVPSFAVAAPTLGLKSSQNAPSVIRRPDPISL